MTNAQWILEHADTLQVAGFLMLLATFIVAERLAPRRCRLLWPSA